MIASAVMSPRCMYLILEPAAGWATMAGNSLTPSMLSMFSLKASVSVNVTEYLPTNRFATSIIIGRCSASKAASPSFMGNKLHTNPRPSYLAKVSPSRTPNKGTECCAKNAMTASLSVGLSTMSMGSSPLWSNVTFGLLLVSLTKYHEAFNLWTLAAAAKPSRSDGPRRTILGSFAGSAGLAVSSTGGRVMKPTHSTMPSAVRSPSNLVRSPPSSHSSVGYPSTP
mmetsp:Transcript_79419/g.199554  ORF Transcript_79419/g.199554 Transcript_79419/m.199554 type:complete len:225 (-) Transcript_79419:337-1011(-)